jgi:hypothetical protein
VLHLVKPLLPHAQVWSELRNFKKCLIQMFMKQGQEVIFFETALRLGEMRSHAVVEAVPVPPAGVCMAAVVFVVVQYAPVGGAVDAARLQPGGRLTLTPA